MYVHPNFRSKKDLKAAIVAGQRVEVYSPGPFPAPSSGEASVEGPHYPEPHRWYARVRIDNGLVIKVIG